MGKAKGSKGSKRTDVRKSQEPQGKTAEVFAESLANAGVLVSGVSGILFGMLDTNRGGEMAVCRLALAELAEIVSDVEAEFRSKMEDARHG
jgi:hypothetical protein